MGGGDVRGNMGNPAIPPVVYGLFLVHPDPIKPPKRVIFLRRTAQQLVGSVDVESASSVPCLV